MRRRWLPTSVIALLAGLMLAGCTTAADPETPESASAREPGSVVLGAPPAPVTTIATTDEAADAIAVSQALFAESPVVILVSEGANPAAARAAIESGVPMLVAPRSMTAPPTSTTGTAASAPDDSPADLLAELDRLGTSRILAVGDVAEFAVNAERIDVAGTEAALSAALKDPPRSGTRSAPLAAILPAELAESAAAVTAQAAGATMIIQTTPGDILAAPEVIASLSEFRPAQTLLIGDGYAAQPSPEWAVRAASTGFQLPAGGQRLFGHYRFVALYGVPDVPVLGLLGEQGVAETIDRAQRMAAEYEPLSDVPVIPTLEIIATVAAGQAGGDGNYSNELDPALMAEYADAATAAGMYVVLDLQPGRSDFLSQAQQYRSLLERPNVGLALDGEWRLGPDQVPLKQIGSVSAAEVNSVTRWLADLVNELGLPPKMLVLHEFRVSMITDREAIDTSRPELELLVHVDGQGSQPAKQETWRAMLEAPPKGVALGWKNFIDEDHPMLTPTQTMTEVSPTPDFVSYQ